MVIALHNVRFWGQSGHGAAQKTLPDLRRDTARQNKENNRRNREGRFLDGTSLAVSQAGVNDLIAPEYSHHRLASSQRIAT
jgi:hypothetical protein